MYIVNRARRTCDPHHRVAGKHRTGECHIFARPWVRSNALMHWGFTSSTMPRHEKLQEHRFAPRARGVRDSSVHGHGVFATRKVPSATHVGAYAGRRYAVHEARAIARDDGFTCPFGLSDGTLIDGAQGGSAQREPGANEQLAEHLQSRLFRLCETVANVQVGSHVAVSAQCILALTPRHFQMDAR